MIEAPLYNLKGGSERQRALSPLSSLSPPSPTFLQSGFAPGVSAVAASQWRRRHGCVTSAGNSSNGLKLDGDCETAA